jgi:hypothetical protein
MITAVQAVCSWSLPHFLPGVGQFAREALVTESSLLVLLVGAEEQREAEGCNSSALLWCVSRGS